MSVRLHTQAEIDRWKAEIGTALEAAGAHQHRALGRILEAHGLRWSDPVPDQAAPLWSAAAWAEAVEAEIAPVARRIAGEMMGLCVERVQGAEKWAVPDATDKLAKILVDRVASGGTAIGKRMSEGLVADSRYGGRAHPDATPTIFDEYQARLDELNTLAENVASAMSNAAQQVLAETATQYDTGVSYVWNCAMLDTSRPEHIDADGQEAEPGQPFTVGDEELLYPGDPSGSDENICNCLCWLELNGVDLDRDYEASLALDIE